jgi:L-seryl-tRNA(Ser) seleniumtransferase
MVQQSVGSGAALTFFSGDKLVGGPQAGIIVGKKEAIARLEKHPLARAVRIDKVRLAGLIATLIHYLKGEAEVKIPVWRMISAPLDSIERRAKEWVKALGDSGTVIDGESMVGGGSLPGGTLPTRLVAVSGKGKTARQLSEFLRKQETPVIGRIERDVLLLDPHSALPEEDKIVLEVLHKLVAKQ